MFNSVNESKPVQATDETDEFDNSNIDIRDPLHVASRVSNTYTPGSSSSLTASQPVSGRRQTTSNTSFGIGIDSNAYLLEPSIYTNYVSLLNRHTSFETPLWSADRTGDVQTLIEYGIFNTGNTNPTSEDIVNAILDIQERTTRQTEAGATDGSSNDLKAIAEENDRLLEMVQCMLCVTGEPDILFLPCAHHRICHACAGSLTHCPVCQKTIREKVKTYRS